MSERPTFSPFWHRVRALRPRLRPHVQITRQHYRGRRWHVVHDPATNQFYRLNPIAHEFVGLLDGRRTVEEAWNLTLERHADSAPTQQEALQLIGQLYNANLLSIDVTPEVEQLLRRGRERVKRKAIGQVVGIMYFKIRLFNPDAIISAVEPILRPILNRWGFLAWLAFMLFAVSRLIPHQEELFSSARNAIAPANWGWLSVVFIVTKAIHELGHGVILKRFGRQVPECGMMLLVLFPAPYVDASGAWALSNKWQRIAVGGGGMIFELFVAAAAALVWVATLHTDGSLVHQLAYNAMFIASISTVLFNANPLMRFDGYYMLSDLIEVPNLMQRSQNMLKHYFKVHAYGLKREHPPTNSPSERWILNVYGVGSLAYRIFLFITITLHVMGIAFAIGLLLAIWTAAMWFILPIGKFVHWIAASPNLADKRARAVAVSLLMGGVVFTAIGVVPMPDHRRAIGVVESRSSSGIYVATDGFVREVLVRPGDRVRAGDVLVRMESPDLVERIAITRANVERLDSLLRQATQREPTTRDSIASQLASVRDQLAYWLDKQERLRIVSPHDGVVVGNDPALLIGAFLREGEGICEIVDDSDLRIVATLGQHENSWAVKAARGELDVHTEVRFVSRAPVRMPATIDEFIEAGQSALPHAALGYGGGGTIQTRSDDRQGRLATSKQFEMRLTPEPAREGAWTGVPGERVRLRFTLADKPLAAQWADRLHKLVQGRVTL
ncbi:MAG: PqqD family peptide modification chaperone [Phycisphaeraceae bacterium]|nr:PqqD family peptide modification chaperone [Phycisphaeraceae bacterium]